MVRRPNNFQAGSPNAEEDLEGVFDSWKRNLHYTHGLTLAWLERTATKGDSDALDSPLTARPACGR